jgi:hypothetical protein
MAKGKVTANSFWFKRTFYPAGMAYSKIPEELRARDSEIQKVKEDGPAKRALSFNTVDAPPAPARKVEKVEEDGDTSE